MFSLKNRVSLLSFVGIALQVVQLGLQFLYAADKNEHQLSVVHGKVAVLPIPGLKRRKAVALQPLPEGRGDGPSKQGGLT